MWHEGKKEIERSEKRIGLAEIMKIELVALARRVIVDEQVFLKVLPILYPQGKKKELLSAYSSSYPIVLVYLYEERSATENLLLIQVISQNV